MTRKTLIHVDLKTLKLKWLDWCKSKNLNPSDALRMVVNHLVNGQRDNTQHMVVEQAPEKPTVRREVKLTQSENKLLEQIADREGFSANKWLVALVRTKLTNSSAFGQVELEHLSASNSHLLAIGRNLNQIAKALNTDDGARSLYRIDLIEELSREIKAHAVLVSKTITANVRRWEIK